jgi:hypothetical protein
LKVGHESFTDGIASASVDFCANRDPALATNRRAVVLALLERFKICKNVMNVLVRVLAE